jgi:thioredoxin reductase
MVPPGSRPHAPDPASVTGKAPPIGEATDLLVIGAGPAGVSAALAAAGRGVPVTLVDENPIPLSAMGEEVPLHFGGRMGAVVANRNAMLEAVLEASPRLAEAVDAGIDVRLGTAAWGLFPRRLTTNWIGVHVAGLADADRAYLIGFKQVIVACGRRDMGLAFEGWERPGVMGASAAYRLAKSYGALEARTAVLLGAGTEALQIADALSEQGVRIAAIIEQAEIAGGPQKLLARLVGKGARVLTRHIIEQASGDSRGVTAVRVAPVDGLGRRTGQPLQSIECDTVLLGVGAVAAIELLEAGGCAVRFQPERGGHAPLLDGSQRTSLPYVYAAGDCAGIWPSKTLCEAVARREGAIAARAALEALGVRAEGAPEAPSTPDGPAADAALERLAWVRAAILQAPGDPQVCQCEEVTCADILSLRPPRYLGRPRAPGARESGGLAALEDVPPHPDAVKRLTRAGMGPCQGRRCREQIAALLALAAGRPLADVPLATYRPPVRPLRLDQLAGLAESAAMAQHWDSWFGMPTQWVPFWRVPPSYTVAARCTEGPEAAE